MPPGYNSPENQARHYPVFYLNDGQNLFDPATAYIGIDWQADEAADRLIREGRIPPLIIVGIDNAQKDRAREYLPYRSFHPPIMRPQGKRYPDFLLNEVMPFVYQHYRIARGPENTGLGGSSLGAIARSSQLWPARVFSAVCCWRVRLYSSPSGNSANPAALSGMAGKDIHGDWNERGGK